MVSKSIFDDLMLSSGYKACLRSLAVVLAQVEVYDKKMVDSINDVDKSNVQKWKELVLDATFSINQVLYNELMQWVISDEEEQIVLF